MARRGHLQGRPLFAEHFSGPGRDIGPMCVCLSVCSRSAQERLN